MNDSPHKFFIYVRKSTDESNRQVLSIQAQLFKLHEFAKREGLTVIRTFEESRTATLAACGENPQTNLWRREGDSNPRYLLGIHAFQACALNRSAISPSKCLEDKFSRELALRASHKSHGKGKAEKGKVGNREIGKSGNDSLDNYCGMPKRC